MKVYIVTKGEYSDYCIEAVFLDKKEAKKYIAVHDENDIWNYYDIEEYETRDGKIVTGDDNPVGYVYSCFLNERNELIVSKNYRYRFKNSKLKATEVWLPKLNYKKAKEILIDRYMQGKAKTEELL